MLKIAYREIIKDSRVVANRIQQNYQKNFHKMATRETLRPKSLSGTDLGSFAYVTIKDRLPGILTTVIDQFSRRTSDYHNKNELEKAEDSKIIVGKLSQLKNEMQTNKPLKLLEDIYNDCEVWNEFIANMPSLVEKGSRGWFDVAWLSCECYLYRRMFSAINQSNLHKDFDPFAEQKKTAFETSLGAMKTLAQYTVAFFENKTDTEEQLRLDFETLLEYCLWGNKCDLSISAGIQVYNQLKESSQLQSLSEHIISNHTERIYNHLLQLKTRGTKNSNHVVFILDNSGFELYTDLCFADFLLEKGFCEQVRFHVKDIPWFVSDVMRDDFHWTVQQCAQSSEMEISLLGGRWQQHVNDGRFVVVNKPYWTYGSDYAAMNSLDGALYDELAEASLIILKGDLNYRKLVGDRAWNTETSFEEALHGFCPAPLCTLRTLKADVVVGLAEGKAQELEQLNEKWMVSGEYAVVQFCENVVHK